MSHQIPRKKANGAILESPITQAPADEGLEEAPTVLQEAQQPTEVATTEASPIATYEAAQAALEDTKKRLAELAETLKDRQGRRVAFEQHLMELRAAERQAAAKIPIAEEGVNAARADALLAKYGTLEARAAAGRVATAEQCVEEAKEAAEQASAAIETALAEASEINRQEMVTTAELAELRPLIPHLEQRVADGHRAIGLDIATTQDARIAEAKRVLAVAQKQTAAAEAALTRVQAETDAALVDYPEVRATRQSAVPAPLSAVEEMLEHQLAHLELLGKYVSLVNIDNLPPTGSNSPFWFLFVLTPNMIMSAFRYRDAGFLKDARQAIQEYLQILKGYRMKGWIS
jgi:chromosome segregation ATPase